MCGRNILSIADGEYRIFFDEKIDGLVISVFQDIASDTAYY
jgi:hypothetical protein